MYTLEEINEAARTKGWKMFFVWLLVFGAPMVIMTYMISNDKTTSSSLISLLSITDCGIFFGALIMAWVASYNTKKKMMEENAEEEQRKRDERYKRIEELLEKGDK